MILGELLNFAAYAFVEAILVTPLGALSVVICAILSHWLLKEKLTLFGWIGCFQCIMGSVLIALNGPKEASVATISEFKKYFLAPGFLSFGSVVLAVAIGIIVFVAPKRGKENMIWYILVCSLVGGLSVSCTQALGSCIVTSIRGHNQFKNWFIYFLLLFVVVTLLVEIFYLNKALALFNTAMVTPTYYVIFTFSTLVTSVILYQGLKASAIQIMTIVLSFFVICTGIIILQMSKVDPRKLSGLDRKTTMLLQAAREEVDDNHDSLEGFGMNDTEKALVIADKKTEEPGIDTLSPGGTLAGTIIRARKRTLKRQRTSSLRDDDHSTGRRTPERTVEQLIMAEKSSSSPRSIQCGAARSSSARFLEHTSNISTSSLPSTRDPHTPDYITVPQAAKTVDYTRTTETGQSHQPPMTESPGEIQ